MKWATKLFSKCNSKIKNIFAEIREVLAEGNSFFRSTGFAFIENMLLEQDLSSLFNLLTTVLPALILLSPRDIGINMSLMNLKIISHADNLKKYLIEELVHLAEGCIYNFEKNGKEGRLENSLLLQKMFNKDKLFDFAIVMLMRTMLYDAAAEKNKRKIQQLCQDDYYEHEMEEEVFELMAMATKAKLSHYKNEDEYFWYNNQSKDNIKVVSREKENKQIFSIAYDQKFLENSNLF